MISNEGVRAWRRSVTPRAALTVESRVHFSGGLAKAEARRHRLVVAAAAHSTVGVCMYVYVAA